MKQLRWAMDSDIWELDISTPTTLEGTARPVPGDSLPLGLSRGTRLSRPNQIDFFHRFMATPLLPSYSSLRGFSLQRVLTIPFSNSWYATLLGQFNCQKFLSYLKESGFATQSCSSRMHTIGRYFREKSLYALGLCTDFSPTPDDTLLLSYDSCGDDNIIPRKKAVLHHKFSGQNLTAEAVWPGLFVDNHGDYWDVPLSMAFDLASVASDCGPSYHFCVRHNHGSPKLLQGDETSQVPVSILPGLSVKSALCYKKMVDIWRSSAKMLKMKQAHDIFLSNPHVSASGIIGAAMTARFGDNSVSLGAKHDSQAQDFGGFSLHAASIKSAFLADTFASVSLTAQHGNFQRMFLDLTRCHARLNFPSGSRFLSGASSLAQDFFNSQQPTLDTFQAICPEISISLQQQVVGPFSFRVDAGFAVDLGKKEFPVRIEDPVFAVEHALQVLGSAKAVAWYSPKHKEFMIELRFYET